MNTCIIRLYKSVSASLFLALLLVFPNAPPIFAQVTVYGEAGTLLVNNDGSSGYAESGISLRHIQNGTEAWADFTVLQAGSDLSAANVSPFALSGRLGFDAPIFGVNFAFGAFHHGSFYSDALGFPVNSEGGAGAFLGLRLPLRLRGFTIEPSMFWGEAEWEDGSLYWALGKPDVPEAKIVGVSTAYKGHSAAFYYISLGLNVFNNDNIQLFSSKDSGFAGVYTFSFEVRGWKLGVSAVWAYAEGSLDGGLTDSNQHYWLFPYIFYYINGEFNINAGLFVFNLRFSPANLPQFFFETIASTAHVFSSHFSWTVNYKNKNLFGGQERSGYGFRNIRGMLGIFLRLGVGWNALPVGKTQASFGLRKTLIIPVGLEQLETDTSSKGGGADSDLLQTILLSGLSFYMTWRF
ncbi:MAG: hypothetical protein LBK25_05945 [Treponema sp.]|nr:hypothetical protein [Treponema sp.]